MQVRDLERLYDYGYWANQKVFELLAQLTPGEFTQPVAGSYGSLRNTLVHVLSAEWGWLERCGGPARGPKLIADDYPTVDSLRVVWSRVEGSMREFLASLRNEDLGRSVEFTLGTGATQSLPLGDLLHHGAIHAVHHRGQVALLLRLLGKVPGNFDLLIYAGEQRAVRA